ncbi:hypothetical protein [Streptomyces sp. bgisy027]|uniref:hypothetical protein n=1 Tax=Streptomyces sp. bgisy027 TaxID=3413770 RepID=UPI003D70FDFD
MAGWTAQETAEPLDTSVASANSAVQRGRSALRQTLPERREDWSAAEPGAGDLAPPQRYMRRPPVPTSTPWPSWSARTWCSRCRRTRSGSPRARRRRAGGRTAGARACGIRTADVSDSLTPEKLTSTGARGLDEAAGEAVRSHPPGRPADDEAVPAHR